MRITGEGFAAMAATVRSLADEVCGGRLAYLLEGGYSRSGLRERAAAVLDTALPAEPPSLPPPVQAPEGSLLARVVEAVISVHGSRYPGLGAF
jgi:acetoin utilization deacetylase AcuC-like enzyme